MALVMVVDDNKDLRYSIVEGLTSLSTELKFIEAESGKQALSFIDEGKKPDLILLDIMMPEMDGWDVASEIKKSQRTNDIPIIFLTAKTDTLSKGMGKLSAEDYVEKPFDPIDLYARIKKVLKIT
jgi:CheY-like chemotaxis protein